MRIAPYGRMGCLAALLALGGCASTPPSAFYQLQTSSELALAAENQGPAILLGPLEVADYLQREVVVQRTLEGNLQLGGAARWAGSLEDDIARVLLRELSGRTGSSQVALYPDRVGFTPQVQVLLSISRFDAGPDQPAVLEAQWRLLDAAGTMRHSQVLRLEHPHTGSLVNQVRMQSQLLHQLAERLAQAIKALPETLLGEEAGATTSRRAPRMASSVTREERTRRSPVSPVSTPVEVYRF